MNFIFPILCFLFAIFFLILSKNEKNYRKIVEDNGEKFANSVNKWLKICGYSLLVCSLIWLVSSTM